MKRLSLSLTVLLLGGAPLVAVAADYGPNAPLLASNASAPQLPGAQARAAAHGEMPMPDAVEADAGGDADNAGNAATLPEPLEPRPVVRQATPSSHAPGPTASNKSHAAPIAHPVPPPATASWQSLLPGSIQ